MYAMTGSDEVALVDFLAGRGHSLVAAWKFVDDLKRAGFKVYYTDPATRKVRYG